MKQHKIRVIQSGGGTVTWGLSIPLEFDHWRNIIVTIRESGNCLILESGASPSAFTMKDMKPSMKVVEKIII